MRWLPLSLFLVVAACSADTVEATSTTVVTETTTTAPPTTTTTLAGAVDECPSAPYQVGFLPTGVGEGGLDMSVIEPDVWTSVGGTHTTFFGRTDGTLAIAMIRGTLPAVDWPAEKGEIDIDGTRAAIGPHADGTWAAGWFVAPGERCDTYTMVFYPPWSPLDVETVLLSMIRVAG